MRLVPSLCVLLGLSAATAAARAQEAPITFDAAVAAAGRNPRVLQGRRASAVLRRAEETSPGLDANPIVTVTGEGRVTPGSEQGFEGSIGVTQSLSVQGNVRLRRAALGAESRWLGAEADAEQLARRLAAASAWLTLRDAEEQLALCARDVENERRFVDLVTRLVAGRERTAGDVAAAAVRLEESLLRERMAQGAVVDARALVAAEVGTPAQGILVTAGPGPEVTVPSEETQRRLLEAVAALPSVRVRTLLARAEDVRAQEERAARGTRLTLGVQARRDSFGEGVLQASVAVPLPIFDVGQREFAARHAAALRMEGEAADEQVRARAAMLLSAHDVEHTGEVFDAVATRLVPSSERAVGLRERLLTAGEGTVLDVLDARRSLFEARFRLVRATRDRAWARIRMAALFRAAGSIE